MTRAENKRLNDMHDKHHRSLHRLCSKRDTQRGEVHQLQLGKKAESTSNNKSYCHWHLETASTTKDGRASFRPLSSKDMATKKAFLAHLTKLEPRELQVRK